MNQPADNPWDVIVVGAGVAGCYTAWRLAAESGRRCLLLEGSDRIGGRLYSVVHSETPHIPAELGGMRFKACQRSVIQLIEHLGLAYSPFSAGGDENLCFARGQRFKKGDLRNPDSVPYQLGDSEQGRTPDEILSELIERVMPVSGGDIDQQLRDLQYRGLPLWKTGWLNILSQELSADALHYVREVGSLDGFLLNWNAYSVALQHYLSELDEPFLKLDEGFQALPLELHRRFMAAGGRSQTGAEVTRVVQSGGDLLEVVAREGERYQARSVVLALPRRAIELLDLGDSLYENPDFELALRSVRLDQAAKVFLWYEDDWWTELGLSGGSSATDLPLRQCHYFGTEQNQEGHSGGLLMATYNDGDSSDYWDAYARRELFPNQNGFCESMSPPADMLDDLQQQLESLHGRKLPRPHSAVFQDWNDDPYGGGWHHWNPNCKPWEVIAYLRQPFEGLSLHICGEAWSASQGWVMGALDSSETLLREQFHMPAPDWLRQDN